MGKGRLGEGRTRGCRGVSEWGKVWTGVSGKEGSVGWGIEDTGGVVCPGGGERSVGESSIIMFVHTNNGVRKVHFFLFKGKSSPFTRTL